MRKYSKEVVNFINSKVITKLGFKEITDENIDAIVDYLADEYEIPLGEKEDSHHKLSSEEKENLRLASKAITEITSDPAWSK